MYAIANVIYGIDLTTVGGDEESLRWVRALSTETKKRMERDPAHIGLDYAYSGSGDVVPMWVGKELFRFDECDNFPLSLLAPFMNVTPEMEAGWKDCIDKLDPDLYNILLGIYGENPEHPDGSGGLQLRPEVMIVWSTS